MPVELQQVTGLADVILQDHFEFLIPNVPGGGDGEMLNILNMTAVLPGRANNVVPVELHRHKVHFSGKRTYTHSFQATYVATADREIIEAAQNWQNMQTYQDTGLPRPKRDYATSGLCRIYGADNQIVEQREFFGLFISNVADISLSGSSNQAAVWQITFNYDYWLPLGLS